MIQWYPGHMAKAKREIEEKLKLVDIVFELIDARIPVSSKNPMIDKMLVKKPRLVLMTKADMADQRQNRAWKSYFESKNIQVLLIDSISKLNINHIVTEAKRVLSQQIQTDKNKGLKERAIRAMIVGIPNVGKSTLINSLVKKKVTTVGDKPGVTKTQQWINLGPGLELLDTPGVLWPKFDDPMIGMHLAITGAIKDNILPIDEVVLYAIRFLIEKYPKAMQEKYKLENLNLDPVDILTHIGKVRGALKQGGEVDYTKVYDLIIHDIRNNKIAKITFDWCI
ncbi:MAG TPA: ribosome biogenesis GTPase YlqF [Bacilli bacterium]|nr:ribosome biogenesis GTPase YlqF [Bacilli bacterium]